MQLKRIITKAGILTSILMIIIIFAICCSSERNGKETRQAEISMHEDPSSDAPGISYMYSPLTHSNFNDIINDTSSLSHIGIIYMRSETMIIRNLVVDAGRRSTSVLFSELTDYEAFLQDWCNPAGSVSNPEATFTPAQIQQIYDYLELNQSYFFDNSEYFGIYPPPVESYGSSKPVCDGNYVFSLIITEPNEMKNSWAIHKCVDEYPEPDHPLYGLFEILEDDFISQFE